MVHEHRERGGEARDLAPWVEEEGRTVEEEGTSFEGPRSSVQREVARVPGRESDGPAVAVDLLREPSDGLARPLVCFFIAPWAQMNDIHGSPREAFYFLGHEIQSLQRTFGISRDVGDLHIRCLLLALLSVPALAIALLLTPPRTRRPWALVFTTLLAGALVTLLVRYQRHVGGVEAGPWYAVTRGDASSLLAFVPALAALVVATLAFLEVTPRRVLLARVVAAVCALAALSLPGQTVRASYVFDWGARLMGVAAAVLVALESHKFRTASASDAALDG